jgi:hypothetical protein
MASNWSFARPGLQKPGIISFATVVAVGLAAHLLLPATDYVVWDGWWQFADIAWPEGPAVTKQHLAEVGRPLDLVYYWPFRFVSSFSTRVWLSKLLSSTLWICSACLMLGVLLRATNMPQDVAGSVAATVASCPVFATLGEFSLWMYTAAVFLFWGGWFTLVCLPRESHVVGRLTRLILWPVFFLSFNLNSQLVTFYAVCGCLFVSRLAPFRLKDAVRLGLAYASKYWDLLMLPLLFWLWKKTCTPTTGAYAGYNSISLSPDRLATGASAMVAELLWPWMWNPISSQIWVFAALVAAVVGLWIPWSSTGDRNDVKNWSTRLVAAGLFLLAANSFPYLAVGQVPSAYGWNSRNAILAPLPLGLLAVGAFLALSARLPSAMTHAWKALVVAWIVLNTGVCFRNYLALQSFGVKQESISIRIHEAVDRAPTAALQLRDYFSIPATVADYAPSIWTFLPTRGALHPRTFVFEMRAALPDQQQTDARGNAVAVIPHVVLTTQMLDALIDQTTLGYAMTGIPRTGRHVLLCIRPTRYTNERYGLGSEYLWRKWFNSSGLQEFVREATTSDSFELPQILAGPD